MARSRRRKRVPHNRRIYRLAVLPGALLLVGMAGASYSQAQASQSSCSTQGGLLPVTAGTLCETLGSATTVTKPATDSRASDTGSGLTGTAGAAAGGVTGTVGSVVGGVTGTVGSVVGGVTDTVGSVAGSLTGGSNSTATSSGSPGTGGTSGSSSGSGSSTSASTSGGSTGPAGPVTGTVQPPAGARQPGAGTAARARRAALAAAQAALIGQLPGRLGLTAVPGTALPVPPGVRLGPSQPPATRRLTHSLLPRPLWLLIAAACGLAGGIGLLYSGWRNFDLVRRRRRAAARRYAY